MSSKSKPLVSVICVCFDQENYVVETLNSVKNQSYNNIELIIIDDASSDNSLKKIKKWISNDTICLIENNKNIGLNKSFNKGFNKSKGKFIVDLAADDILLPDSIADKVDHFIKSKNKNLGVVFSNVERIDDKGKHISHVYKIDKSAKALSKPVTGNVYQHLVHSFFISAPSMLIKKDVLLKLKGYDENLAYEDLDFWIRSSRLYEYEYVDKILVKKRIHNYNLSHDFKRKRGRNLGKSTLIVCRKAFNLNKTKNEHQALRNRVNYQMRWEIKNMRILLVIAYLILLGKINYKLSKY